MPSYDGHSYKVHLKPFLLLFHIHFIKQVFFSQFKKKFKINVNMSCFVVYSYVLPDTSKKSCQKTRVLKRTASPVFNHTMVYDGFRTEDLKEACVELTVWDHDRLADHLVGGLRLGLGTGTDFLLKLLSLLTCVSISFGLM